MDAMDRYIKRLSDKGSNPNEAKLNNSKRTFNEQFTSSPSYVIVKVDGLDTDSIVTQDNQYDEKIINFRSDSNINIGSVIDYKSQNYLLLSFFDNEIFPKGKMKLCNSTYPLPSEITRTIKDYNQFGEPIYTETVGEPTLLPCIVETTITSDNSDEAINLPTGQIQITIPFTEHEAIGNGVNFFMYGSEYETIGIDYTKSINGVGLLVIKGKKV